MSAASNFKVLYQKVSQEEFPKEKAFIWETIAETKQECATSVSNRIGLAQALHDDMSINE